MAVDYSLLSRFEANRTRYAAARAALPARWRSDPRPEAQEINEFWVDVIARTREHLDRLAEAGRPRGCDSDA